MRSWQATYGVPAVVVNCSNNYGPYQFPEKLIPLVTIKAMAGEALPVYGTGANVRDWLFVDDHAAALCAAIDRGQAGQTYLVGGDAERSNLHVVHAICDRLDQLMPVPTSRRDLIQFVEDRPGHDLRYAVDAAAARRELAWSPSVSFEEGLAQTVDWYVANRQWWQPILDGRYDGRRLGSP